MQYLATRFCNTVLLFSLQIPVCGCKMNCDVSLVSPAGSYFHVYCFCHIFLYLKIIHIDKVLPCDHHSSPIIFLACSQFIITIPFLNINIFKKFNFIKTNYVRLIFPLRCHLSPTFSRSNHLRLHMPLLKFTLCEVFA